MKKIIASTLVSSLILSQFALTAVYASEVTFADTENHWAKSSVERWANEGIVGGYEGNFRPDANITRGEVAVILDRIMGYELSNSNTFTDLDSSFYTESLLKANKAGIVLGSNNQIRPNDQITREEVAVMIVRAMHFDATGSTSTTFADDSSISSWAKESVAFLAENGILNGKSNNNFEPQANMTRAEVSTTLDRVISQLVREDFTQDVNGNVVVNTAGVTLSDMTITGDLILSEGIEDGDVFIKNTKITGDMTIKGGGANSIYLENVEIGGELFTSKQESTVRVVTQGTTEIQTMNVSGDVLLVEEGKSKIYNITIVGTSSVNGNSYTDGTTLTEVPETKVEEDTTEDTTGSTGSTDTGSSGGSTGGSTGGTTTPDSDDDADVDTDAEDNTDVETPEIPETEGEYSINATNNITGGSISFSHSNASAGERVSINIKANDGYDFESLTVKDTNGNTITVTNNTFVMPECDVVVTVTFTVSLTEDDENIESIQGVLASCIDGELVLQTTNGNITFSNSTDFTEFLCQEITLLYKKDTLTAYKVTSVSTTKAIRAFKSDLSISGNTVTYNGVSILIENDIVALISQASSNATIYIVKNSSTDATIEITEADVRSVIYVNDEKIITSPSEKITSSYENITFEDNNIDVNIKAGDYVLVTENKFTGSYNVEVIGVEQGEVIYTRIADGEAQYYINNIWYTINDSTVLELGAVVNYVAYGNVIYSAEVYVEVNTNYVVVTATMDETDSWTGDITVSAKIIDRNGDEAILTGVTHIGENKITSASNINKTDIYTVAGSEGNWILNNVVFNSTENSVSFSPSGYNASIERIDGVRIDSDAIFFVTSYMDSTTKILTGEEVKSWKYDEDIHGMAYTTQKNGIDYIKVANIFVYGQIQGTQPQIEYGYVTEVSYSGIDENGKYVKYCNVFNGNETTEIKVQLSSSGGDQNGSNNLLLGAFISYALNEDGYSVVSALTGKYAAVTGIALDYELTGSLYLVTGGYGAEYMITLDTDIIYIDAKNTNGVSGGTIMLARDTDGDGELDYNVYFVANKENEIEILYVDASNQIN